MSDRDLRDFLAAAVPVVLRHAHDIAIAHVSMDDLGRVAPIHRILRLLARLPALNAGLDQFDSRLALALNESLNLRLKRLPRVPVRHIIDGDDAINVAEISLRDAAIAFLPGCIPELHAYNFVINLNIFLLKVDSDRRHRIIGENVVGKSEQE